jgi:predicted secreted hydrolase
VRCWGMRRRGLLLASWAAWLTAAARASQAPSEAERPLRFPADFGAHPASKIEWWYATGTLVAGPRLHGFQITFFRAATGLAAEHPSRFAARQVVFAHAALSDLAAGRYHHDERIGRGGPAVEAATGDTRLALRDWTLAREGPADAGSYRVHLPPGPAGFGFELRLVASAPPLLQGIDGLSQKGPRPEQSSRYYSRPQLSVAGTLSLERRAREVTGRAWLDHEWSDSFLDRDAVGWDWIGMNLDDGSALMAFQVRHRDGTPLHAGGSLRARGGAPRNFDAGEIRFIPGRAWRSPASGTSYPVEWRIETPAGIFGVQSLLDPQELDSRASTGAIYWEGLADLSDARGARIGRGSLEMTGYAAPLTL